MAHSNPLCASDVAQMMEAHPYVGPRHDVERTIRASLASSCLRGEMRVWQFQAGHRGRQLNAELVSRVQGGVDRGMLIRAGVFHKVATEPRLCGEEALLRPFYSEQDERVCRASGTEYAALGQAMALGHVEMAEWIMEQVPAFRDGLMYGRLETPLRSAPIRGTTESVAVYHLMRGACAADWSWGVRRIEQLVNESDEPTAVEARNSGVLGFVLAMACASVGASAAARPGSVLRWVEHFVPSAHGRVQAASPHLMHAMRTCTLPVAEWLIRDWLGMMQQWPDLCKRCMGSAAAGGNVPVLEWLLRAQHQQQSEQHAPTRPSSHMLVALARTPVCSVPLLRFCTEHGVGADDEDVLGLLDVAAAAAAHDPPHLAVLEYLHNLLGAQPGSLPTACVQNAARRGSVATLQFLLGDAGLTWNGDAVQALLCCENPDRALEALEWMLETGRPLPAYLFAVPRDARVVRFLAEHTESDLRGPSVGSFHQACSWLDLPVVEALVRVNPALVRPDDDLRRLGHGTNAEVLEFLLRRRHCADGEFDSAFIMRYACGRGSLRFVEWLYRQWGPAAEEHVDPQLLLESAVRSGSVYIVEWLIRHRGATPTAHAVQTAIEQGHLDVVKLLWRDDVRLPLDSAATALDSAAWWGHLHVVRYLLEREPALTGHLRTPVASAKKHHWPTCRYLKSRMSFSSRVAATVLDAVLGDG